MDTSRAANISRQTKETEITCQINLDGRGLFQGVTGIGFLDHMLELVAFHSQFDLSLQVKGDLYIDAHHTIEDIGITLGQTLDKALGDRRGIRRYACCFLPMDETLTRTVLDVSGRFTHIFQADLSHEMLGQFPTEMAEHFFYSVACQAKLTLHQQILYGKNLHHQVEALFKGFGRALHEATVRINELIPSTKGKL